jgi:hypothetical protein
MSETETEPRPAAGILARALAGRVDRSIIPDVGLVAGVVVIARGLVLLSSAYAWIFVGAAIVAVSLVAVLPAKPPTPKGRQQ